MKPAAIKPVVHLELHTGDLARARAFYAELCGWRAQRIETAYGSYVALDMDDRSWGAERLGGGIVECPIERPLWLPYVEVETIGAATERAQSLGASMLVEPREGPVGWRSVVATRAGGVVALWQSKR